MSLKIKLKNIVARKEVSSIIHSIAENSVIVMDSAGGILYGRNEGDLPCTCIILHKEDAIGLVKGHEKAQIIASLLSYLADLEFEKKSLVQETLGKYKEITMLYEITEKLSEGLDEKKVTALVIEQAKKIINKTDHISIMILNNETGLLELANSSGKEIAPSKKFKPGEGIAGDILLTGKAEIINDVLSDPRFVEGNTKFSSLICAPLKVKDKIIGVINISSKNPVNFTAEDLKLLSSLAFQAAVAIENAKLFFIREAFGRYLPDEVVKKLIEKPGAIKLGGENKIITILMSDLRGFTILSEQFPPETVVAVINNYLKTMVDLIHKYNGAIIDFIGDAIMIIFGAPIWTEDHATLAVACAVEMQSLMKKVNRWNIENGLPEIEMGIGINTGKVVVGNIGSEKRVKFSCIGSQVNLASRIESYTVGGQILISGETLKSVRSPLTIYKQREIIPKGIINPITIFDIKGIGEPFNLYLEEQKYDFIVLTEELPVSITIIEDKHDVGNSFKGLLTKLSLVEAEISTEVKIPPLTDIKMEIYSGNGKMIINNIFAKTKMTVGEDCSCVVHLTSISQEGKNLLNSLIKK